jgi:hypothetical protein
MSTTTMKGGASERTDNPKDGPRLLTNAPLCQAQNRAGSSCRCPAVSGKRVCRMHGGKGSGATRGEANGNWKYGGETREAVALRKSARDLITAVSGEPALP